MKKLKYYCSTGKSYVLNRLLGKQDGFAIGPTVNPCTKGIYTWGRPIEATKNGKKIYYILIDTEGIGSIQQDQTYDAKIFSLTLLLSSYFIYNSMGMIDEHALDKLSLVANLTQNIQVKSNSTYHIESIKIFNAIQFKKRARKLSKSVALC
jgi:hypothetical protein